MEVALIDKGKTAGFFAIGMAASSKMDKISAGVSNSLDSIYDR
jgi:hypothetical protein